VTPEALILFDIDGTLVRRAGPHHRQALVEAVRDVAGLESTTDHIAVQGMLDPDILRRMMLDAGASQASVRRAMPALVARAQAIYPRRCPPSLRSKVCPGVRPLLKRLAALGVPLALVTGNLTRIAWTKLRRAGIGGFFRYGAFAEMARDRAGLVRLALAEARRRGLAGRATRLFLVGDHPNDVAAARLNGVRSVAVATGLSNRAELAAHAPDFLFDDLRALRLGMLLDS
jgi:phosphoglycolate phosphatase